MVLTSRSTCPTVNRSDARQVLAEPESHRFLHADQLPPQLPGRVENGEVIGRELPQFHDRQRQGIAQRQHRRRRSTGSQPQGAGLRDLADLQHRVREPPQPTGAAGGHGDDRVIEFLDDVQHPQDLIAFPAGREHQHDVALAQAAQIPMHRVGGTQEMAGGAGRGERGRELAGDVPCLAHARRHQRRTTFQDQAHRLLEVVIDRRRHALDGRRLRLDHLLGTFANRFIHRSSPYAGAELWLLGWGMHPVGAALAARMVHGYIEHVRANAIGPAHPATAGPVGWIIRPPPLKSSRFQPRMNVDYRVELDVYHGPLDLLLYLISGMSWTFMTFPSRGSPIPT